MKLIRLSRNQKLSANGKILVKKDNAYIRFELYLDGTGILRLIVDDIERISAIIKPRYDKIHKNDLIRLGDDTYTNKFIELCCMIEKDRIKYRTFKEYLRAVNNQ